MTDIEIIKLVFGILLGIGGLVLVVLAFLIGYKYLVQESRCTARIRGTVIRYTRAYYGGEDSGVHLPVVSYAVDGEEYTVTGPKYKAYVTHTRRSPLTENRMEYEEKEQVFRVYNYINSVAGRYYIIILWKNCIRCIRSWMYIMTRIIRNVLMFSDTVIINGSSGCCS